MASQTQVAFVNTAHQELTERGFQEIEAWKSCYWEPELKVSLVLYVDDFKLSGPKGSMAEAWKKIREAIQTGDPHPLSHFLGCTHEAVRLIPPGGTEEVAGQVKTYGRIL